MRTRSPLPSASVRSNRARLRVSISIRCVVAAAGRGDIPSLHAGAHPPVEVDRGARDEGSARGDEERHQVAELFRLAHPTDRHPLGGLAIHRLDIAALGATLPLLAFHETETNGVHADSGRGV